ncbi:MAG TPA: hypothetical protein VNB52_08165, partial [Ilumatobacteraceae bacterium]|nr:hypothetical protein [Ilumatobacteraceae bacterium]
MIAPGGPERARFRHSQAYSRARWKPDTPSATPWDDVRVNNPVDELIVEGRAALRAGDAAAARQAFERVHNGSTRGDVIEGLARVSYLEMNFPLAIGDWERAYAAHRDCGDHVGAVRVARTLAYMN